MSTHALLLGEELHDAYQYVQESDPGAVGAKKNWLKISTGQIKRRNDANNAWIVIGGASTSTELTDFPNSLTGQATKSIRVKADETGWELYAPSGATIPNWVSLQPDATPGSPNALDDEFDDADTLPGGGSAQWTWINQGLATADIVGTSLVLTAPAASGDNIRMLAQTCPLAPWEFTAKITPEFGAIPTNSVMGICGLQTGAKLVIAGYQHASSGIVMAAYFNSVTSYSAVGGGQTIYLSTFYVRLKNDGTNLIWSFSHNGVKFYTYYSTSLTTFLTGNPDSIGLCCASEQNTNDSTLVCDWFRRTL